MVSALAKSFLMTPNCFLMPASGILDACFGDELDAEAVGYHRQLLQRPFLPVAVVFLGTFQTAQVPIRPCYLIAVTFIIAVLSAAGSQYLGDITRHAGLLCDTYCHIAAGLSVLLLPCVWAISVALTLSMMILFPNLMMAGS